MLKTSSASLETDCGEEVVVTLRNVISPACLSAVFNASSPLSMASKSLTTSSGSLTPCMMPLRSEASPEPL